MADLRVSRTAPLGPGVKYQRRHPSQMVNDIIQIDSEPGHLRYGETNVKVTCDEETRPTTDHEKAEQIRDGHSGHKQGNVQPLILFYERNELIAGRTCAVGLACIN